MLKDEKNLKEKVLSTELTDTQIAVFYLGQEGILIKYRETYLLFDAYLSDYVDQNCCSDAVIWKRNYDAPIDASELDFVDYVFCSHPHYDHADPITLRKLNETNYKVKYIVPYALKEPLHSYGIKESQILLADADIPLQLTAPPNILVTPVPAAHEQLHQSADGHYEALGYIVQLGETTIFHAGDCCIYKGLSDRLQHIDIGFLPINGRDYYRLNDDIIGNMDSREAILLAKETKVKLLVPMHFDLYNVNEVNPGYFVDLLFKLNRQQSFHIFAPGERLVWGK